MALRLTRSFMSGSRSMVRTITTATESVKPKPKTKTKPKKPETSSPLHAKSTATPGTESKPKKKTKTTATQPEFNPATFKPKHSEYLTPEEFDLVMKESRLRSEKELEEARKVYPEAFVDDDNRKGMSIEDLDPLDY